QIRRTVGDHLIVMSDGGSIYRRAIGHQAAAGDLTRTTVIVTDRQRAFSAAAARLRPRTPGEPGRRGEGRVVLATLDASYAAGPAIARKRGIDIIVPRCNDGCLSGLPHQ